MREKWEKERGERENERDRHRERERESGGKEGLDIHKCFPINSAFIRR